MDLKAGRISKWARGVPQGLVRVELHPTNRCNLKGRFCWQTISIQSDFSLEMSDSTLMQIVHDAHDLDVRDWIISGGARRKFRRARCIKSRQAKPQRSKM